MAEVEIHRQQIWSVLHARGNPYSETMLNDKDTKEWLQLEENEAAPWRTDEEVIARLNRDPLYVEKMKLKKEWSNRYRYTVDGHLEAPDRSNIACLSASDPNTDGKGGEDQLDSEDQPPPPYEAEPTTPKHVDEYGRLTIGITYDRMVAEAAARSLALDDGYDEEDRIAFGRYTVDIYNRILPGIVSNRSWWEKVVNCGLEMEFGSIADICALCKAADGGWGTKRCDKCGKKMKPTHFMAAAGFLKDKMKGV